MGNIPHRGHHKLTFPISDTMPGPGTFEADVVDDYAADTVPGLATQDDDDYIGHGTAEDIPSSSHAPKPFEW